MQIITQDYESLAGQLLIFRSVLKNEGVRRFIKITKSMHDVHYNKVKLKKKYGAFASLMINKAEKHGMSGNIFQKYLIRLIMHDENVFSLHCEKNGEKVNVSLHNAVMQDIQILKVFLNADICKMEEMVGFKTGIENYIPESGASYLYNDIDSFENEALLYQQITSHYARFGCGMLAKYRMFRYHENKGIEGIKNYDTIMLDEIIGYAMQKEELIANTEAFIAGYPANNVLLTGSRGTGKSSCVKALANAYFDKGLRLVEITKEQLVHLPDLLKQLSVRGKRFIIFIDDLSFEEFEVHYKYLKSMLEGSAEKKPENVLFYATSNRRHLIQEKWADRKAIGDEEVHSGDAMNEKISLSDRFGISIHFAKPNQQLYLAIVRGIAKNRNLQLSGAELENLALQWELSQKGMSGRTAKQFIDSVSSQKAKG